MTDIVEIIRPRCKGNASVMIAAYKLHEAADEIKRLRSLLAGALLWTDPEHEYANWRPAVVEVLWRHL